ncbi:MAG: DUF2142 domain-containing protein [Anaerolineales bacterium]|nr:DUF2142 domain-containing protein [Anaerolineales bacterium]
MQRTNLTPLWLILLLYAGLGSLFAVYTPDWQAPDEPAHYNYVRQLANGRLPVMAPGDYDQDYIVEVVFESGFDPRYAIEPLSYEDWQPPLYYLLLTPVFWLTGGSLLALRLASLLLGAGVVALAYGAARQLAPGRDWLAGGTAVFVALLPQHLSILAAVNNDALAELLIAAMLVLLLGIDGWRTARDHRRALLLGVLLGLGFLTKATVYPMAGVIGVALLLRYRRDWRDLLRVALWVSVPALLLGALWWGRNAAVYGGLDVLGKAAHDAVVVGQPRTAALVAEVGAAEAARQFAQTTFRSFWGQFGWMTVPMLNPGWLYPLLGLFTAVALLGLPLAWRQRLAAAGRGQTAVLLALVVFVAGVHLFYNLTYVQHQGRYLFPALVPIGLGVAAGLGGWVWVVGGKRPWLLALLPLGLALALAALDLWALFRLLVPTLT